MLEFNVAFNQQGEETVIQRSSIEKNEHGQYIFTECENLPIEASSVDEIIEHIVTDGQQGCLDGVLGKDNCKALIGVIKPSVLGKYD